MANETASEVLAQSNTKTPDFMAPVLLPNPPKPDVSQAKRQAIGHQRALEAAIAQGRPPPGEEWPDEKYLATSELLERAVLPGGERDPLLDPDRPRTVDGEPVPVTDAEYMMREAGRFPMNPLALIGRDETLEKTATADMRNMSHRGGYTPPEDAYDDIDKYLIRRSDRPELLDDPGGSVITAAETFDEEFGPQVIVEGTPTHEWLHAGLERIRQADPDFKLPQFPSEYGDRFSDNLNEEMWVRLIHAHTEDLSAIPGTEALVIDGKEQVDDDGFLRQEIVNKKLQYDKSLLKYTGEDTDYWLSQPSAIRGINSILEKANEVGRELGSFAVTETPSDRAQFAPGGQRRYEGTEISARQPFQEGGIASLPNNPVLGGQQHMLAYITPEEASTLRAQGGGVTPDGGQRRGPGGIAAFWAPYGGGQGGHGGYGGGGGGGGVSGPTGYGNVHAKVPGTKGFVSMFSPAHATPASLRSVITKDMESKMNPISFAKAMDDPVGFFSGEDSFTGSMFSKVRSALNQGLVDITTHGDMDSTFGHVTALTPNMPANTFAGDRINVGDPNSVFGKAVRGLGTTALGMLAPALTPATTAIDLLSGETGLMNLLGVPEIAGDVSEAVIGTRTPLGDISEAIGFDAVTGYIGDQFGPADAVEAALPAPDAGAVQGQETVYGGRPSNLGPGISLPPPAGIPSVEIGLQVPPTTVTETLEDATSSDYTAQQLADATGATLAQAREYLESRYA